MLKKFSLRWIFILLIIVSSLPIMIVQGFNQDSKWFYISTVNDKVYLSQQAEVTGQEDWRDQKVWAITGQQIYKINIPGFSDIYTQTVTAKLTTDYKLCYLQINTSRNTVNFQSWTLEFKDKAYNCQGTFYGKNIAERVPCRQPVYWYDPYFPWTIELLLKAAHLHPHKNYRVINILQLTRISYKTTGTPINQAGQTYQFTDGTKVLLDNQNQIHSIENDYIGTAMPAARVLSAAEIAGLDENGLLPSNVLFTAREKLTKLHVKINLSWLIPAGERNVKNLHSPRQVFTGKVTDHQEEGEIMVTARPNLVKHSLPFPVKKKWRPKFRNYLGETDLIEPAAPEIIAKANEITAGTQTIWKAAYAIAGWVHQNIKYQTIDEPFDAQKTLAQGKGVCLQYAVLTVSLCRAVKIPARCMMGYVCGNGGKYFIGHAWVEVYVGAEGWIPLDPTSGQLDFVDAGHIGISTATDIGAAIKPDQIEVLDYQPPEAATVEGKSPDDPGKI